MLDARVLDQNSHKQEHYQQKNQNSNKQHDEMLVKLNFFILCINSWIETYTHTKS